MSELVLVSSEDHAEISLLKYRYLRFLDTQDWDAFSTCFATDATADYAGLQFTDPTSLVDYMRQHLTAQVQTTHQVHHPELTRDPAAPDDPDRAAGIWYLQDRVVVAAYDYVLEGTAFYRDRYVRTTDGWLISHTGYLRASEMTWSLSDLPSLRFATTERPEHG